MVKEYRVYGQYNQEKAGPFRSRSEAEKAMTALLQRGEPSVSLGVFDIEDEDEES